ncbi:MAG: dephospho-CoA kinase [Myxococcales bacterium]|nr:dephospho-CoA kinase [Myxococcales bacterium]
MKIVGLTGGIGTGKSTVAQILKSKGYPVIDADQVARKVVEPGQPALEQIVATFGPEYLLPNGTLDRRQLGATVFQNPELRRTLEQITHPLIAAETAKLLQIIASRGHDLVFYEAPVLFEAGRTGLVNAIVVVASKPETQMARVARRDNLSLDEIRRRLDAQWPLDDKIKAADYVIWNDTDLEALTEEVNRMLTVMNALPPPKPATIEPSSQ